MQEKVNLCANFPRLQVRWWHLHEMLGLAAGVVSSRQIGTCELLVAPSITPVVLGYGQWLTGVEGITVALARKHKGKVAR